MSTEQIEAFLPTLVAYGENILSGLVIWVLGSWLAGRISRVAGVAMERARVDATLRAFAVNLVRYAILIVAGLAILNRFGIQTTSFIAVLGAAGFAVGLAMQGTLSSFSSGVMLLFFRPFKIGDVIEAAGTSGRVETLELFTTTLGLPDGSKIIVPNSAIYGSTIHNKSPGGERMAIAVTVGAAYDADLDETRRVLSEMVQAAPNIIEDSAAVVLTNLGASSVDWSVRCAVHPDHYWGTLEAVTEGAKKALDQAGIGIPYDTLDVNLVGGSS